ncbi:MAG: hypothetical protein GQ526_13015 [Ardenticatenales bacterium]|nr:hypothetical protein [Ardenticatenales bacterium]
MCAITFEKSEVTKMMEEAIAYCSEKAGLGGKEQARKALQSGDCCVCEYMRHAMAQSMAEYLGSVDDTIKAVYTYEPEYATSMDEPIPGRPNLSPGFNLIARVSRKSAALSSVVASLRSALADECKRLGCCKANALCFELDVQVVDEGEVQKRTGYGALINSVYVRPLEVWSRYA